MLAIRALFMIFMLAILSACQQDSSSKNDRRGKTIPENNFTESQAQSCVRETCGDPRRLPYHSAPITPEIRTEFAQKIQEPLNHYVQLEASFALHGRSILEKLPQHLLTALSDKHRILINLVDFFDLQSLINDALVKDGDRYRIDSTQALALLKNFESQEAQWIIKMTETLYNHSALTEAMSLQDIPLQIFIEHYYPGKDYFTALATEATHLKTKAYYLTQTYPIFAITRNIDMHLLDKAIRKEVLTQFEEKEFLSARSGIVIFFEYATKGKLNSLLLERPLNLAALNKSILKKIQNSQIMKPNFRERVQYEIPKVIEGCALDMKEGLASSPTQTQNQDFKNRSEALKNHVFQMISSQYKGDPIKNVISNVRYLMPPTRAQVLQHQAQSLESETQSLQNSLTYLKSLDLQKQEDLELIYFLAASNGVSDENMDENDKGLLKNPVEFCENYAPASIEDAAYAGFNIVQIGWRSILYPHYGHGILLHELTHLISLDDEKGLNQFASIKQCLAQNKKGKKNFVEEDFADLVAGKILRKQNAQAGNNYACLLLRRSSNGEITHLKLTPDYEGDSHSSSFYRLITQGAYMENQTPSCQQIQESAIETQNLKDCWGL